MTNEDTVIFWAAQGWCTKPYPKNVWRGWGPPCSILQPHLVELCFSLGSPSLFLYPLAQLAPCFLPQKQYFLLSPLSLRPWRRGWEGGSIYFSRLSLDLSAGEGRDTPTNLPDAGG